MISNLRRNFSPGLTAAALFICASLSIRAAISQGPILTNATAAEQRRIDEFYRAEQSFQLQRQVGQKRYDQKQADRAKVIAAMTAELHSRQQTVVMPPLAPSYADTHAPVTVSKPWLAVAALSAIFACIIYFWNNKTPLNIFGSSSKAAGRSKQKPATGEQPYSLPLGR